MLQTLAIFYIDLYTGRKIPGIFVIIKSKTQVVYEINFNDIKQIIEINVSSNILLNSYTTEYEKTLENEL